MFRFFFLLDFSFQGKEQNFSFISAPGSLLASLNFVFDCFLSQSIRTAVSGHRGSFEVLEKFGECFSVLLGHLPVSVVLPETCLRRNS